MQLLSDGLQTAAGQDAGGRIIGQMPMKDIQLIEGKQVKLLFQLCYRSKVSSRVVHNPRIGYSRYSKQQPQASLYPTFIHFAFHIFLHINWLFNYKRILPFNFMFSDEEPTNISKLPGSKTHLCKDAS